MWLIQVTCSDPDCAEDFEVLVDDLNDVEETVCECEACVVVLSVANFVSFAADSEALHLIAA
ncbi:MAG TPA: hypothetical protein VHR18_02130 [Solirubrobacterales bacterium]|jgi:hypothetical protein|nr:hypothetical protein [Solirubrobacterales bacterium]